MRTSTSSKGNKLRSLVMSKRSDDEQDEEEQDEDRVECFWSIISWSF